MKPAICDIRPLLGPFVDGELVGADRLRVSQHLVACADCADEVEWLGDVGQQLRVAASNQPLPVLSGMTDGVLERVRAESRYGWHSWVESAIQDWRFALVGAGSLAATCFCVFLAWAAIAWDGPARANDDSIAARLRNLGSHSGVLMLVASPAGGTLQDSELVRVDNGAPGTPAWSPYTPVRSGADAYLVGKLMDVVTRHGLRSMREPDRREAEALLDEMKRPMTTETAGPRFGALVVHEIHLVTDVLTVKGL